MGIKLIQMEKRSDFVIQFASLPMGKHEFDYNINDSFFKGYENALLQSAQVKVHVVFSKAPHSLELSFQFKGSIKVECGRCLEEFGLPLDVEKHLLVRPVSGDVEEMVDEEVLNISDRDQTIDLRQHIYDYLSLQVPLNPLHPEGKNGIPSCDPKVMELLKKVTVNPPESQDDPRWNILKNIKLN